MKRWEWGKDKALGRGLLLYPDLRLDQRHVHACAHGLVGVDGLADREVALHAHEAAGVGFAPAVFHEDGVHLADGAAATFIEGFCRGDDREAAVFDHRGHGQAASGEDFHAHGHFARDFEAVQEHFTVAHHRMQVTHGEQRAVRAHGEVDFGTLGNQGAVHVAAVIERRFRIDTFACGRYADDADHGREGDSFIADMCLSVREVEGRDGIIALNAGKAVIIKARAHEAPISGFDGKNRHLQDVALFRTAHIQRTRGGVWDELAGRAVAGSVPGDSAVRAVHGLKNHGIARVAVSGGGVCFVHNADFAGGGNGKHGSASFAMMGIL